MPFQIVKEIDPRDADPCALGEFLRGVTFVPEDQYGCYETFDVRDRAWEYKREIAADMLAPDNAELHEELMTLLEPKAYQFGLDGYDVRAAWYWDGDGTLLFEVRQGGRLLRRIENTDCKKSNYWRDNDND